MGLTVYTTQQQMGGVAESSFYFGFLSVDGKLAEFFAEPLF